MGIENDNDYQNAIKEFKEYVNKNNTEVSDRIHEGFLIDYGEFVNLTKNEGNNANNNILSCESAANNKPNLTPKAPNGLKNKINSGNKFVLINRDFYNKVCNKNIDSNIHIIKYRISQDAINLYGDNNEVLKFQKNNINLIEIDKAAKDQPKEIKINVSNNIDKIYTDIINYFNLETNLQKELGNKNANYKEYQGFFVDKEWDDKWKKYSYYDTIKTRFLINNICDKDTITKVIKEEQAKNYLNYDELNDVEKYLAKNIKEVYNSIKFSKKSYVILNQTFLKQFEIKDKFYPLPFFLSYQNILIKPEGEPTLNCKANNNIISLDSNIIEPQIQNQQQNKMNTLNTPNNNMKTSEYLKHLIRTIYLKQEFLLPNGQFRNQVFSAYLIKKEILKDLKEKFRLNELILKIEKNPKLNGISFRNFDNKFPSIIEAINESDNDYFNSIKQYDTPGAINYTLGESLLQKNNINGLNGLHYIDNFEIIDGGFANFLYNRFNQQLHLPQANFIIIENYILLMINLNNEYTYEILSFTQSCELTVEYLIYFASNKFSDISQLNNYVFQYFIRNGIQKLISLGNPIRTENDNLIFNIIPIYYNKLRNSIQNNKTPDDKNNLYNIKNNDKNKDVPNGKSDENKMINNNMSSNYPLKTMNNNLDTLNPQSQVITNHNLLKQQMALMNNHNQTQLITLGNNQNLLNNSQIMTYRHNLNNNNNIQANNNIDKLEHNLKVKMYLIKAQEALRNEINQYNTKRQILNKDCYLIKKSHINELNLNQIKEIMNQHPGKNEKEMLKILKEKFPNDTKIEIDLKKSFNELQESHIYKSKLFYPKNYKGKDLYYFKNSEIITDEFLTQLDTIDKNYRAHCLKVPCVFDMNKIIILLNNQIINIADYNGNNIIVEYIIKLIHTKNAEYLFGMIKKGGYNFISQYLSFHGVRIPVGNNYYIEIHVYKLTPDGNIETRISDKFKALLFLAFSQYYNDYNTPQKVYLINPKWLKQFNYDKIKNLIYGKNNNIPTLNLTELNSISGIIPYFDKKVLRGIDESIIYDIK